MSNQSGFEIMADNDCFFFSSAWGKNEMDSTTIGLYYVAPCAFVVSAFVGFLILSKEEN